VEAQRRPQRVAAPTVHRVCLERISPDGGVGVIKDLDKLWMCKSTSITASTRGRGGGAHKHRRNVNIFYWSKYFLLEYLPTLHYINTPHVTPYSHTRVSIRMCVCVCVLLLKPLHTSLAPRANAHPRCRIHISIHVIYTGPCAASQDLN
jgi:hypothetical protein